MDTDLMFRVTFFAILVIMFSISTYFRKKARAYGVIIERKDEGVIIFVLRMVLALPLLASFLIYVFYPRLLAWSTVALPLWLRYLFVIVAIGCIPVLWWVFRNIGRNISETVLIKSDHQLVTTGPYKWVRHPLYATTLLLLGSFSIIASNWFIFAYFIVALLTFRFLVIPEEEKRLVEAFGEKYLNYQKRTGALVPRLSKNGSSAT